MGNAQDPSAPPSPYTPPPAPGPDMNALSPPINTPGLAVPSAQPALAPPPAPMPAPPPPAEGTPQAIALATPEVGVPNGIAAPTYGGSVRATIPGAPTSGEAPGGFGGAPQGAVAEARARGRSDAAENAALKKQADQAVEEQKVAQNAVSEVERNQASDLGENIRHQQTEMAAIAARGQTSQAAQDKVISQRQTDWDNAVNAQKNMVFDPDKYVNNMSVGNKIFTSIAIGLSAFGNSRSIGGSGENLAMKTLNDSIQHYIDQQKEAYRRAGLNIDMAQNAYGRARQAKMDDYQATLAAKQSAIDDHKMAAQVITARYDPDRISANKQLLDAHLDAESAKTQQEYAKTTHAEAARAAADVLGAQQTGFNMALGAANYNLAEKREADDHADRASSIAARAYAAEQKAAGKEGSVAGWFGVAPTPDQQNKAAATATTERILVRNLQEMADFKQDYGNEVANREKLAEIASTAAQVKIQLKDKAHLGVMSASDEKLLDNIARDPTALGSSDAAIAQFKHLIKQVHADSEDEMASYGMRRDRSYKGTQIIDERPKEGGK